IDFIRQITSPAANMSSEATPNCGTTLPIANAALNSASSASELPQSTEYCGVCSYSPCQGAQRYAICGWDNPSSQYKTCDMYLGGRCSEDDLMICHCGVPL